MPEKKNPLNLNALQLKTLTLLQALARLEGFAAAAPESGHVRINRLPHAHGDHFHVGPYMVSAGDANGLGIESVWLALERRGLVKHVAGAACDLTPAGLAYDTGLANAILHRAGH